MTRYRKLPVVIEAVQWTGERAAGDGIPPAWYSNAMLDGTIIRDGGELKIRTLESVMIGSPGDFIVKGIAGEIYACKPDIFAATYELA